MKTDKQLTQDTLNYHNKLNSTFKSTETIHQLSTKDYNKQITPQKETQKEIKQAYLFVKRKNIDTFTPV